MKSVLRVLPIAARLVLAGCDTIDMVSNLTSGWFSGGKKLNIKGERISVLSEDESLKIDPELAKTRVVLPKPYRNAAWPEPGGYAANAMYHLEANGPLAVAWQQEAGKGSDSASRLTAAPIIAENRIYALDAQAHLYVFDARSGAPLWNRALAPS